MNVSDEDILDLFAGPGGWSQGLRLLGHGAREVGIEIDDAACATRKAAGFVTVQGDISQMNPNDWKGIHGFIASPPCQSFSAAGKQLGFEDVRGQLVFEVIRWVDVLRPEWIACEQVPGVLPVWKLFEKQFQEWGYRTWCSKLNAADYGVPQTRTRAILMASREPFDPPAPTHAEHPTTDLFGDNAKPWVTMAEALGWEPTEMVNTRGNRQTAGGNEFGVDQPSWALTEKTRSWVRYKPMLHTNRNQQPDGSRQVIDPETQPAPTFTAKSGGQWEIVRGIRVGSDHGYTPTRRKAEEPAPTLAFGKDMAQTVWEVEEVPEDQEWATRRPSTTIVGSFRPDVVASPGWRDSSDGPRQNAPGSVRVEYWEAGILQSFPVDYPWQGSKTKIFQQIGNAVPPVLGAAVLEPLIKANA